MTAGKVLCVARDAGHNFSKQPQPSIRLIAGEGVEGDAHRGTTVKHRSRVALDPNQPNLRQVHLIHGELLEELAKAGFAVEPAALGENITTHGVDLLSLPRGALLRIGSECEIELTGLRNPCKQIEAFQSGLLSEVLEKTPDGEIVRKSGVMGVVKIGGEIGVGDPVEVVLPPEPHEKLERV